MNRGRGRGVLSHNGEGHGGGGNRFQPIGLPRPFPQQFSEEQQFPPNGPSITSRLGNGNGQWQYNNLTDPPSHRLMPNNNPMGVNWNNNDPSYFQGGHHPHPNFGWQEFSGGNRCQPQMPHGIPQVTPSGFADPSAPPVRNVSKRGKKKKKPPQIVTQVVRAVHPAEDFSQDVAVDEFHPGDNDTGNDRVAQPNLNSFVQTLLDSFQLDDPNGEDDQQHSDLRPLPMEEDSVESEDFNNFPARMAKFHGAFKDEESYALAIATPGPSSGTVATQDPAKNLKQALEEIKRRKQNESPVEPRSKEPSPKDGTGAGAVLGDPFVPSSAKEERSDRRRNSTDSKSRRNVVEGSSSSSRKERSPSRKSRRSSPEWCRRVRIVEKPVDRDRTLDGRQSRDGETRRVVRRVSPARHRSRSRSRSPLPRQRRRSRSRSRSRSPRRAPMFPSRLSPDYAGRRWGGGASNSRDREPSPRSTRKVVEVRHRTSGTRSRSRSNSPTQVRIKRLKELESLAEPKRDTPAVATSSAPTQLFTKSYLANAAAAAAATQAEYVAVAAAAAQQQSMMAAQQIPQQRFVVAPSAPVPHPMQNPAASHMVTYYGHQNPHLQPIHDPQPFVGAPLMPYPQVHQQQQHGLMVDRPAHLISMPSLIPIVPNHQVSQSQAPRNQVAQHAHLPTVNGGGPHTSQNSTAAAPAAPEEKAEPKPMTAEESKTRKLRDGSLDKLRKVIQQIRNLQVQQIDLEKQQRTTTLNDAERDALAAKFTDNAKLIKAMSMSAQTLEKMVKKHTAQLKEDLVVLKAVSAPGDYEYVDPEYHWCQLCDVWSNKLKGYLAHLQSSEHAERLLATGVPSAPWRKALPKAPANVNSAGSPSQRVPFDGAQFLQPVRAWYCELCNAWMGDGDCAQRHMASAEHNENFLKRCMERPDWVMNQAVERNKALRRIVAKNQEDPSRKESGEKPLEQRQKTTDEEKKKKEEQEAEEKRKSEEMKEKRKKQVEEWTKTFLEKEKSLVTPVAELEDAPSASAEQEKQAATQNGTAQAVLRKGISINIRTPLTPAETVEEEEPLPPGEDGDPVNASQAEPSTTDVPMTEEDGADAGKVGSDGKERETKAADANHVAPESTEMEEGELEDSEEEERVREPPRSSPVGGKKGSEQEERVESAAIQALEQETGEKESCSIQAEHPEKMEEDAASGLAVEVQPEGSASMSAASSATLESETDDANPPDAPCSDGKEVVSSEVEEKPMEEDPPLCSSPVGTPPEDLPEQSSAVVDEDDDGSGKRVVRSSLEEPLCEAVLPEEKAGAGQSEVEQEPGGASDLRLPEMSPVRKKEKFTDPLIKQEPQPLASPLSSTKGEDEGDDCLLVLEIKPGTPNEPDAAQELSDCTVVGFRTKEMKTEIITLEEEEEAEALELSIKLPDAEVKMASQCVLSPMERATPLPEVSVSLHEYIVLSETGEDSSPDVGSCAPALLRHSEPAGGDTSSIDVSSSSEGTLV